MTKRRSRVASPVLRLALIGAEGRLGSVIEREILKRRVEGLQLEHRVTRSYSRGFKTSLKEIDVVLDVSTPKATVGWLKFLAKKGAAIPYVVGCTGWNEAQLSVARDYSRKACLVFAPNFSPAVNLMLFLVEKMAPQLRSWGYTPIVTELHHDKKVDSPSGTAKAILRRLGGFKAQVHSSRAGNIVGTHQLRFVGPHDVLTVEHEALDRAIFAHGALLAALWAGRQKTPGFFSMQDVFKLT